MSVFYTKEISGNRAVLDKEESRHCIRVLRLGKGARIRFVDGEGGLYEARIEEPDPAACVLNITGREENYLARDYRLHIAISPTKSTTRFEWFLEKATEIGVDEITPLICERSERSRIRMERSGKIMLAAMKQSGRSHLPVLNEPVNFPVLVGASDSGIKLIAHCEAPKFIYDGNFTSDAPEWLVLIGPEGDFTAEEISRAIGAGFSGIRLGDAVFRTETAGIVVCQIISGLYRNA